MVAKDLHVFLREALIPVDLHPCDQVECSRSKRGYLGQPLQAVNGRVEHCGFTSTSENRENLQIIMSEQLFPEALRYARGDGCGDANAHRPCEEAAIPGELGAVEAPPRVDRDSHACGSG